MGENWIEIDKDAPVQAGDRVRLYFTIRGPLYLKATQLALIDKALEMQKAWRIKSWTTPPDTNQVIFTVDILKTNPIVVTCAAIAGVIVIAGITLWLTFDKAEKAIPTVFETTTAKTLSVGAVLFILFLIYRAYRSK